MVANEARIRIAGLYNRIETDRGVLVPDTIRLFLSNRVRESLFLHQDDWQRKRGLDPAKDGSAKPIAEEIYNSLFELLNNSDAEPWTQSGIPQISLIGIIEYIHQHWCGIWPICR
jgi:hypothetical protein